MASTVNYPPVSFHFSVEILGLSNEKNEIGFRDVTGLSVTIPLENVSEGGENRFVHKFPGRPDYSNVSLKRGYMKDSSLVNKWCKDAVQHLEFSPKEVHITLLNNEHAPLVTWKLVNAFPVKWSVSDFSATESNLLIETLELSYQYFEII